MCSDDVNDCVECALCIACCYACCLCCCKDKNNSSVANQPSPAIISQPNAYGGGGGSYPQQDPYGQYNNYPYGQQQKDASGMFGYNDPTNPMMQQGQYGNNPYPPPQGAPPPYQFHQGPPPPPGTYFPPHQGPGDNVSYYPPNVPPPPPLYPGTHNMPDQGKY